MRWLAVLVVLLLPAAPALGQGGARSLMGMMGGGNAALWIAVAILAAALVGVIVYLITSRGRSEP